MPKNCLQEAPRSLDDIPTNIQHPWNQTGTKQKPCKFIGFRGLAAPEPPWNQTGTKQEPREFIGFRGLATSDPSWNQTGAKQEPCEFMGFRGLATSEPSHNQTGTKQEPCEFVGFRKICNVGTIVEPRRNHRPRTPDPINRQGSTKAGSPALHLL